MGDVILNKKVEDVTAKANEITKAQTLFQGIAFRLNDNIYAMDVMYIMELIISKIFKVPNTDKRILGVLNMRGAILPVYSLKLLLGMEDELAGLNVIDDENKFIIMIKKDKDIFGVLIDGIYKNITATNLNFKSGKYLEKWSKNEIFSGVIIDDDKEILTIDINHLLKYIISLNH